MIDINDSEDKYMVTANYSIEETSPLVTADTDHSS